MSSEEVAGFLDGCGHMVVGALDADGWPTGTLATVDHRQGRLAVRLPAGDPLGELVTDGTAVVCTADEHATYHEIRGVIAHGTARAVGRGTFDVDLERVISFDFARVAR